MKEEQTIQNESNRNGMKIAVEYYTRTVQGTGTTNYVSNWIYKKATSTTATETGRDSFEYDSNGNVTKYTVKEGSTTYVRTDFTI